MSKVIKIYCEGKAGSHDFDLISKVIDGLNVQIKPIGGKRGAKSAIQVYEAGLTKSHFKIFFRDRDFDAPVPDTVRLQNDGSYVCYSYRTTIENYLLEFKTIEAYSEGKSWKTQDLYSKYCEAATRIRYFQATRHTLGVLRVPTDFGTNIVAGSGKLPNDLTEGYCREKGYGKVLKSLKLTENWTRTNYDLLFDRFAGQFDDQFIQSGEFLVYFQGKDFMKSLCTLLPRFSPKDYYNFAKARFDYREFADLIELRGLVTRALNS